MRGDGRDVERQSHWHPAPIDTDEPLCADSGIIPSSKPRRDIRNVGEHRHDIHRLLSAAGFVRRWDRCRKPRAPGPAVAGNARGLLAYDDRERPAGLIGRSTHLPRERALAIPNSSSANSRYRPREMTTKIRGRAAPSRTERALNRWRTICNTASRASPSPPGVATLTLSCPRDGLRVLGRFTVCWSRCGALRRRPRRHREPAGSSDPDDAEGLDFS